MIEKLSGANFFVTGVTGFLAKIIVEKLLYSVPNVGKIFLLIRTKKNQSPADRLHKLMTSRVFNRLRSERKDAAEFIFQHLVVVSGDITMERLGMSDADIAMVQEEVNIFIHSAATINFNEPLADAVNQNVLGTLRLFAIAQHCKRLLAFTHISTAYVNCIKKGLVEEVVYPLDFDPQQMLDTLLEKSPEEIDKLTPQLLGEYPNSYTFTKSLTEHLLLQRRGNIPLLLFRPTIIGASYKEPSPGWIDTISAASALYVTAGVGVMKFMLAHRPDRIGDQVPADLVSNSLIAATADIVGEDRYNVVQMGTSKDRPLTWNYVKKTILPYLLKRPPKRTFSKPYFFFVNSDSVYNALYFLQYRVPIAGYNVYAHLLGTQDDKKQALMWKRFEQRVRMMVGNFNFFVNNEWIFDTSNNYKIIDKMSPAEVDAFFMDPGAIDWEEYLLAFCYGMKLNLLKEYDTVFPLEDRHCPVYLRDDFGSDFAWAFRNDEEGMDIYKIHKPEKINEDLFFTDRVRLAIRSEAEEEGISDKEAQKRARDIIRVMVGTVDMKVMRTEGYLFRKFYRHMYKGIFIDEMGMKKVQLAAQNGPLILIPSHRSYVDFLITSFFMFDHGLPIPRIAAGDDFLNMFFVNWVFRNSGAFFMRRSFNNDSLYKTIFAEYVQQILSHGHPLEFFIEGTRSRSGKTLPPKFGLLSVIVDAVADGLLENAHIAPVCICYDRIVEEESHALELYGDIKTKPSTRDLIKASLTKLTNLSLGRISIQFSDPIPVTEFINSYSQQRSSQAIPANPYSRPSIFESSGDHEPEASFQDFKLTASRPETPRKKRPDEFDANLYPEDRWEVVEHLGYEVVRRFNRENVIMSTNIVAALLTVYRNGVSKDLLAERYSWLVSQITRRGGRVDPIEESNAKIVQHALSLLSPSIVNQRSIIHLKGTDPLDRTDRHLLLQLSMYRNGLLYLFQREAIVALTLVSFGSSATETGVPRSAFDPQFQFLSEMLYEEFVDPLRINALDETLEQMKAAKLINLEKNGKGENVIRLPPAGEGSAEEVFAMLLELFWPFIDSYWAAAASLFALQPSHTLVDHLLVDRMQWVTERAFEKGESRFAEACSKDSLRGALRTFKKWKIIEFNDGNSYELTIDFQDPEPLQDLVERIQRFRCIPSNPHPRPLPSKPYLPSFSRL